ncbi:MAG TPA: replicative DNA helicase [Candidatus Latescibacteria bacterium]|nr:replicative DNA helicase [Candidatus Latescibacterota bacterium]HOS65296.1 replicative DNA helicase [Candidatus Latescibacterota bacterium]HPC45100.1 replicative DNA helicase [Candidatus Latescibacterota bacterium]HPK75080.1 replicative DNA helicase [Candidatus Latescibacterota bacterium]HRS95831.1 replicative DNA helicase [Candidatus Latescibacterota bacterium]
MAGRIEGPAQEAMEELASAGAERVLPHSILLEQQVLGAMMLNRQAVSKVVSMLDRNAFYRGRHRLVFDACVRLYEADQPADLPLVIQELTRKGELAEAGGAEYVADIAASVGTSTNVEYHAQQILELAVRRRTIALSSELINSAYDTTGTIYDNLERFENDLFKLAENRWREGFSHIEPIMHRTYERIEKVSTRKGEVTGVPSGFAALDEMTAGFQKSELIIVAARPGMGKTALVLNMARNAALQHKLPVGIFSLEMSAESVAQRLLCAEAHVDGQLVRRGRLNEHMWNRLSKAVTTLANAPIYIDDSAALSPLEVRAKARRLVHEHSVQLIIVDYLQLMRVPGHREGRAQEVAVISQALKALAKDLDIPIIACSQVTREVEKRGEFRPRLSDLRESGSIEQDADVVIFVHRPEYYKITHDEQGRNVEGLAEILLEKQRNGPTGKIELRWTDKFGLFETYRRDDDEFATADVEEDGELY